MTPTTTPTRPTQGYAPDPIYRRLRSAADVAEDDAVRQRADALMSGEYAAFMEIEAPTAPKGKDLLAGQRFRAEVIQRESDGTVLRGADLIKLYHKIEEQVQNSPSAGWSFFALKGANDLGEAQRVPALWGDDHRLLVPALGRYGIVFGADGVGKSTLALNVAGGALNVPGYDSLLGYPVHPIPEDKGALVIAIDGAEETVARLNGMGIKDVADGRLFVWQGPLPWDNSDRSDMNLTNFVELAEANVGIEFGLIVLDNAMRAYGDVSQTTGGDLAARSLNRVMSRGETAVVVITQSKKVEQPLSRNDALASAFFISGSGAIVSMHHPEKSPAGFGKFRHWKGYGYDPEPIGYAIDLDTGRIETADLRAARDQARSENKLDDFLAHFEPGVEYTRDELQKAAGVSSKTAKRRIADVIEAGKIERANPNDQGKTAYYRLTRVSP